MATENPSLGEFATSLILGCVSLEGEWLQNGLGDAYEQIKAAKTAGTVLGKVSTPEDVASGILAMVLATNTTGHTLVIDGGDTVGPKITKGLK